MFVFLEIVKTFVVGALVVLICSAVLIGFNLFETATGIPAGKVLAGISLVMLVGVAGRLIMVK